MIVEIADIKVKPGSEMLFETAVTAAIPLFSRARGCRSMQLQRSIEWPASYLLVVEWETLEDHTEHFRNSDDFQAWRALAGPHFSEPPVVRHVSPAVMGF